MGRKLGQHFLSDPRILDRIVDALDPATEDVVIEVGPGQGTLTRRLAPRVGKVIAIERDLDLVQGLRAACSVQRAALPPNVTVVHGDALKLDWHQVLVEHDAPCTMHDARCTSHDFKIIGNIPYYITSPLIDKALTPPRPSAIVYLMQREVADRLVAEPGGKTYGAISVGVRAVAGVKRLFTVKSGSFQPPPEVDSAVVRFEPLAEPLVSDTDLPDFRRFVTGLFAQRRKQLVRSLRSVSMADRDQLTHTLTGIGIDPTSRPEDLSPEGTASLFRAILR